MSTTDLNGIKIREYQEKDMSKIEKLARNSFNNDMDVFWAVRNLNRSDKVFVAEIRNSIIGVVEIDIIRLSNGIHSQIGYIFVHRMYWRHGVGTLLLQTALRYLEKRNIVGVWAVTSPENIAARRLFRKFNFVEFSDKKVLKRFLSSRDIRKLLRALVYWTGDIILYLKL
ncbi:MAG: GNAT family N-acetyltransferase [Candidatus Njordarchaeum guaymaensis]